MPQQPASCTSQEQISAAGKKRKLRAQQQLTACGDTSSTRQQTIAELFSSQKSSRSGSFVPLSPSSKRIRLSPCSTGDNIDSKSDTATPLPAEDMYSFTSSKKPSDEMIDLTDSPESSPSFSQPKRPNGAKPQKPKFSPHTGAKNIVVKNLRKGSRFDPKKYLDQVWEQLHAALVVVFSGQRFSFSLEELYRGVENLCRQGHGAELESRLRKECINHLSTVLSDRLLELANGQKVDVLRAVLAEWAKWKSQLITIRSIFSCMDTSYMLHASKPSINDMGTEMFRTLIFQHQKLQDKIIGGACELIASDRNAETLDQTTFRRSIGMFHDLSAYTKVFEPRMLDLSQEFIKSWAERACSEKTLADYVRSCNQFVAKETERCNLFGLDSTTKRALTTMLEFHLIERQESFLVSEDHVGELLSQNAIGDLRSLYSLLQVLALGSRLRPAFEAWISSSGAAIVFDENEQDHMVVKLLRLKKRLDTIWRESFSKDEELGHALRESFEAFINKSKKTTATWNTDNSKPGEMIAKYVDLILRGGAKAIPAALSSTGAKSGPDEEDVDDNAFDEDAEINQQLDQVLDLFRFVHGKAVFEAFYKKDLARRLLMARSASADAERSMLTRLKAECGAGFTQNLEQMFKDVELSREEMVTYKSIMEERNIKPKMDLSVNILSASSWPTYPEIPVVVPADIKAELDAFEKHYRAKHSGRKLDWKHALAHCQLKAAFPKGNRELVVSSFQAIVLLLFNGRSSDERLSYEFIKAETGLPEVEVKRTLQSLACAKLRPLTKHPKGRDINPDDTFSVNTGFSHEKYRIKVNQVQLKETKEENKETHERVAADRNFETQAAIVRIMKSRKTISHPELVAEVIQATKSRGVLNVAEIKKNIDRLIEKDYMEREAGNSYSYIA